MNRASLVAFAFVGLLLPASSFATGKTSQAPGAAQAAQNGYEVSIQGMTCSACVDTVTKALEELPNVEKGSVHVILSEKKAYLAMAQKDVGTETQIKKAIENAGYKVASLNYAGIGAALASSQAQADDKKADEKSDEHSCSGCGADGKTCGDGKSCGEGCKDCGEKGMSCKDKDGKTCGEGCTCADHKGHHHDHGKMHHHHGKMMDKMSDKMSEAPADKSGDKPADEHAH